MVQDKTEQAVAADPSRNFEAVFKDELVLISDCRARRAPAEPAIPPAEKEGGGLWARVREARLTGLAFSGGGIRSATFNLGVLQGLARVGLIQKFDYLSTVSGGGYIGGWLTAWMYRKGLPATSAGLQNQPGGGTPPEVLWLRNYSNYLTPRLGEFSPDTWMMWLKLVMNWGVNVLVLMSGLTLILLLLHFFPALLDSLQPLLDFPSSLLRQSLPFNIGPPEVLTYQLLGALILLGAAVAFIALNLEGLARRARQQREPNLAPQELGFSMSPTAQRILIVFPLGISAWLASGWMWRQATALQGEVTGWLLAGGIVYSVTWLVGVVVAAFFGYLEDVALGRKRKMVWIRNVVLITVQLTTVVGSTLGVAEFRRMLDQEAVLTLVAALIFAGLIVGAEWYERRKAQQRVRGVRPDEFNWETWAWLVVTAIFAGGLGGILLWLGPHLLIWLAAQGSEQGWLENLALIARTSVGPPLLLMVFLLTGVTHSVLMGRRMPSWLREWWERLGVMIVMWALAWVALFGVALHGRALLEFVVETLRSFLPSASMVLAEGPTARVADLFLRVLFWVATTTAGVLAARRTTEAARQGYRWLARSLAPVASLVFIAGLLLVLSLGVEASLSELTTVFSDASAWLAESPWTAWLVTLAPLPSLVAILVAVVACSALVLVLAYVVDVNEFSLNTFYRNRLVRCYLGASNLSSGQRDKNTGFDPSDDLLLKELATSQGCAPCLYPLVNATVSLTSGEELAWQTRKGGPFFLSPLYSGYKLPTHLDSAGRIDKEEDSYRPTELFSGGLTLGHCLAISGAAVAPSHGQTTSAAAAFLLTVFNARLGWWVGNPKHPDTWRSRGPEVGLYYLVKEAVGRLDTRSDYIYVTDGGHFENLGIYELVRRRCQLILACDAEQDAEMSFGGLANAIEKCRVDFGVDISISLTGLQLNGKPARSQVHAAVGTIHYERIDPDCQPGLLVYLKASLTGDEPVDVLRYAGDNREFPHQPTTDQWFDEVQFESYRELGEHIVEWLTEFLPEAQRESRLPEPERLRLLFGPRAGEAEARQLDELVAFWRSGQAAVGGGQGQGVIRQ